MIFFVSCYPKWHIVDLFLVATLNIGFRFILIHFLELMFLLNLNWFNSRNYFSHYLASQLLFLKDLFFIHQISCTFILGIYLILSQLFIFVNPPFGPYLDSILILFALFIYCHLLVFNYLYWFYTIALNSLQLINFVIW